MNAASLSIAEKLERILELWNWRSIFSSFPVLLEGHTHASTHLSPKVSF
jgi:hypothetical protein